jgi:hypothetical protein
MQLKVAPRNKTQVIKYLPGSFSSIIIPELIGFKSNLWKPSDQIQYLDSYLNQLAAKTIIVEHHYIDRHFMDEYKRYYATCFTNIGNSCIRLHVFKKEITQDVLNRAIRNPNSRSANTIEKEGYYLGYIVIRPVPQALVGRTFLAHLPETGETDPYKYRSFPVVYKQHVHMLGLKLEITGLPFQQQDQRVSACASTAIWSALSRVTTIDGMRAPTPSEITEAAVKSFIPFGRPYPQSGLSIEQICEAIRSIGFAPDIINVYNDSFQLFKVLTGIYIKSGIPVILIIKNEKGGHAVTICGVQTNSSIEDSYESIKTPLIQWTKLYFHDDRIGPYSKGSVNQKQESEESVSVERIELSIPLLWKSIKDVEKWKILYIMAPLYPKLRASARDMLKFGVDWINILRDNYGVNTKDLNLDCYFRKSGQVLEDIRKLEIIQFDKVKFIKSLALSRYVGVVDIFHSNELLIRFLLDTTDRIEWRQDDLSQISGVIVHKLSPWKGIEQSLNELKILIACK